MFYSYHIHTSQDDFNILYGEASIVSAVRRCSFLRGGVEKNIISSLNTEKDLRSHHVWRFENRPVTLST